MRRLSAVILAIGAATVVVSLNAHAPSGAIFTTLADGSEVNFNIYPSKEAVYLDGGPGPAHRRPRLVSTTGPMFSK